MNETDIIMTMKVDKKHFFILYPNPENYAKVSRELDSTYWG